MTLSSKRSEKAVFSLMPACSVLVVALVAAINLSVPKLSASSLHPSATALLWIVDIYVLVFGCLLIPAGAIGDRWGRRKALLAGLAVVAIGCLVAAAAQDVAVLIAGRALTGVGAALVMPATLSLMLQTAAPERRTHAVAVWTAATGIAGIAGNVGGGLVLEYLPWQGLFLAFAPIAALLAVLTYTFVPSAPYLRTGATNELDPFGSLLLTAAVAALLFGVIEGPAYGWLASRVLGAFVVSVSTFGAFVAYALRSDKPLLDPRLFRTPTLRGGTLGVGTAFFGLFALFFINAQYLQRAKGFSPLVTGIAIAPLALGMLLISRRSMGWAARYGLRRVAAAGLFATALGLALLSTARAATPYPLFALYLVVMSAGMGLAVPSLTSQVMASLPHARAGLGSGLNGAAREIGSALGVAVFGSVAHAAAGHGAHGAHAAADDSAAFLTGMSAGFRAVCGIVLVLTPAVLVWLRPVETPVIPAVQE